MIIFADKHKVPVILASSILKVKNKQRLPKIDY
jgi:hypothetical protein